MTDTIDCRTCENYRYHPNSGPYCYNEEHWRKHCIDGDQHKSMPGVEQVNSHTYRSPGMTLRDYFASSIIAGLYESYGGNAPEPEQMAEDAYAIADAMLEARATPPTKEPT